MERRKDCSHTSGIGAVSPSSPDSCLSCVALGDSWVHLRVCLICGQVGCCDNSKNKHATRHFHETTHPIIQSYEPGELWRYCYVDDAFLSDGKPVRV